MKKFYEDGVHSLLSRSKLLFKFLLCSEKENHFFLNMHCLRCDRMCPLHDCLEISACSRVYLEHVVSCLDAVGRGIFFLLLLVLLETLTVSVSAAQREAPSIGTCHAQFKPVEPSRFHRAQSLPSRIFSQILPCVCLSNEGLVLLVLNRCVH